MTKQTEQQKVEVWADWYFLKQAEQVGTLTCSEVRGKDVFSFEYTPAWLAGPYCFQLDPSLKLSLGPQFAASGATNFGVFQDSSPDRWGRTLIQKREQLLSKKEKRVSKRLGELDYLLGVFDGHRMGGLRFKLSEGPFLSEEMEPAAPPWTQLRELEAISLRYEEKNSENNPHYSEWLDVLFAPGSSLGGVRPKASVVDSKKNLWIAKFPSRNDDQDVGGWEFVLHELAQKCGLLVPEVQIKKLGARHHTFLTRRFDRTLDQKRIHFASAMSLLERKDGDDASTGTSYLELVDVLIQQGAKPNLDLEELWRRIVFNICVSNTDDHLRNHGLLLTPEGWILSPAYDMNPNEFGKGLSLNISETDNTLSLELALEVAEYFRLKKKDAQKILSEIVKAVLQWRGIAKKFVSSSEISRMQRAFRVAEGWGK